MIDSPVKLWTLLKPKEELYLNNKVLKRFMFVTEQYIKGCKCNDNTEQLMKSAYNEIINNETIINDIKIIINVKKIVFK